MIMLMKRTSSSILFFMLLCVTTLLGSCSSSSENEEEEESKTNIVGVWSDGKHFVSINSDAFLTAYVAPNFIDCGNITEDGKVITCHNVYFNKNTTYKIISATDSKMNILVSYKDVLGEDKSVILSLTKTTDTPATKDHPLTGKTYTYMTSYIGNVTFSFSTYSIALMTSTSITCRKYPLTIFYIYIGDKLYFQKFTQKGIQVPTIGGWTTDVDDGEISVYKLKFDTDGSITEHDNISKDIL